MAIFNEGARPAEFNTLSVMHTGSKFLFNHLLRDVKMEWEHKHIGANEDVNGWLHERPCLVPMRHPEAVAVSHYTRYGSVDKMCHGFRQLVKFADPLGPYYLPLDTDDRQDYLDRINERFGLSLQTRWPIIGSCWERKELPSSAQAQLDDLTLELSSFFGKFGYG